MAITTDIAATTLQYIVEDATEALKRRHAFLDYADKLGGTVDDIAGKSIQVAVSLRDHSDVTFHSNGYEPTNDAIQGALESATYTWGFWSEPVGVSIKEQKENAGDLAILNILETRTRSAMDKMGRTLNAQILANSSVVATCGVNTLYGNDAAAVGFIEGVAKASQNNTVGGLSKSTYNVPGWTNAFASASGAFATNGLEAMDSIYTGISSVHVGAKPVDCIIASEASFKLYKSKIQANERYVDAKSLDAGRMDLMFAGAPIAPDLALTQSSWAGDDIFSMYFINFSGVKLYFLPGAKFELMDLGVADGSIISQFRLLLGSQLVGLHLGSLGVLTNGNA